MNILYFFTSNDPSKTITVSTVSAEKPFLLSGGRYRLEVVGTRISLCKGASKVPNEVIQWIPVKPAPEGVQTKLFK